MTPSEEPATADETRKFLLDRSARDFAPIRKTFVQKEKEALDRRAPLSVFVRNGDLRALRALLFLYAIISNGDGPDGWSTTLPIGTWARAFDITLQTSGPSAVNAASKTLSRLVERNLVLRSRTGKKRETRVTLLREDGSGAPYTRPGRGNSDRYLQLPHVFWTEGWFREMDLPATAMLLVALHEPPGFRLGTENMPKWYGWSADTAERGFKTLQELGVLAKTTRWVKAPLSPTGLAETNEYTLQGAFAQPANATGPGSGDSKPHTISFAQL